MVDLTKINKPYGLLDEATQKMIINKQTRNEARVWPDWRTADPSKALEHDRTKD